MKPMQNEPHPVHHARIPAVGMSAAAGVAGTKQHQRHSHPVGINSFWKRTDMGDHAACCITAQPVGAQEGGTGICHSRNDMGFSSRLQLKGNGFMKQLNIFLSVNIRKSEDEQLEVQQSTLA